MILLKHKDGYVYKSEKRTYAVTFLLLYEVIKFWTVLFLSRPNGSITAESPLSRADRSLQDLIS